jgi:hypothetical protein
MSPKARCAFDGCEKGTLSCSCRYAALVEATKTVRGEVKPYSVCGSLPLVGDLKEVRSNLIFNIDYSK